MKKNSQMLVVLVVLLIVFVAVGYATMKRRQTNLSSVVPTEVFHVEGFPFDVRFFKNQLVVLTEDNTLNFYDTVSGQLTPYSFQDSFFDTIHHFSFSPSKNKAFVIGSKQTEDLPEVRYGIIDLENYIINWFTERVFLDEFGAGYRVYDIAMDSAGEEFLFSLAPTSGLSEYQLAAVNPRTKRVKQVRTLLGEHSLEYYNSADNRIVYNDRSKEVSKGVIIDGTSKQDVAEVESVSVFSNDIVFGSYNGNGSLVFSSINAPKTIRLTLRPDSSYPLLSPSVVRSVSGTYTAYHMWEGGTRRGMVKVMRNDQEVVVERAVRGSTQMFFAPDDRQLLVVSEEGNVQGGRNRTSVLVDVQTGKISTVDLPEMINKVVTWY